MVTRNNQIPPTDDPEIVSGDSETIRLTVKDPEGNISDISGSTVKFKAYDRNKNAVIDKQTGGNGLQIQGNDNEIIVIDISPSDTEDLGQDETYYDYECEVNKSGQVQTVSFGKIKIVDDRIT